MSIADSLNLLISTKEAIKNAIIGKGVEVANELPFAGYAAKIGKIPAPAEPPSSAEYARPADWLELPAIGAAEQKIIALHAVFDSEANHVAFQISGAFTVDWGDGTAPENFASGATASHNYDYADLNQSSFCARGYRQAVITVTPQAGENLTSVNFDVAYPGLAAFYTGGFLDIQLRGSLVNFLRVSNLNAAQRMLEIFEFYGTNQLTSAVTCFRYCFVLQKLLIDFSGVQDANSCFNFCYCLKTVALDFSSVTNATSCFNTCATLMSAQIDFSSVTNANSCFNSCSNLQHLELDFSSVTSATATFSGCHGLRSILLPNAGLVTIDLSQNVRLLSPSALNALYASLGAAVGTGKQVRVTSNYGTAGHNPPIATAKGWSVVS